MSIQIQYLFQYPILPISKLNDQFPILNYQRYKVLEIHFLDIGNWLIGNIGN